MLRQYKLRDYRFSLMAWVIILSVIGIMVIGSADPSYQKRQLAGLILGTVLIIIFSLVDYTWLIKFSWVYYILGCGLLAAVLLFGIKTGGARRWIKIGIQFQPSDLMKIILILFFANFFAAQEEKINTFRIILLSLVLLGIPLLLIVREPDLSTTIVCALTFCVIIFTAGLSFKIVFGILAVVLPLVIVGFSIILRGGNSILRGYQLTRIMAWLHPNEYPDEARQQQNSIIAIGSGQLYGKGLNNNMVSSVKGGNFISEQQTDFIFAVAGEELGFLGCCLIIILELLIAVECINIGKRAKNIAGSVIGCGMGGLIMLQSFINISVATGLLPNTGIPLPFVSYGVTSLVTFCIGIGIVLNVGLQTRKY